VYQELAQGLDVRLLGQISSRLRRLGALDVDPRRGIPRSRFEIRPSKARYLESHELDRILGADQHVLGVERAVDEHETVGGLEAVGDLEGQPQRAFDGQRPPLVDHISQALPGEGLQHQEGAVARRAVAVVHDGHVGADPGDGARDRQLAPEAVDHLVIELDADGQELEGHLRSRLPVVGDVQIARWPRGKPPRHLIPRLDRLANPGIPLRAGTQKGSRGGPRSRDGLRALHHPRPPRRADGARRAERELPGNHVPDCVHRGVQPS
jgi:hypothetical protein